MLQSASQEFAERRKTGLGAEREEVGIMAKKVHMVLRYEKDQCYSDAKLCNPTAGRVKGSLQSVSKSMSASLIQSNWCSGQPEQAFNQT